MDLDLIVSSKFTLDDCPRVGPFTWHNVEGTNDCVGDQLPMQFGNVFHGEKAGKAQMVFGENITGDPLDCYERLNTDLKTWRLLPTCPVPRSIPDIKAHHGTTTLGFLFDGGVVMAVDSRASSGQYIASQTVQKVVEINEYLLGTIAGGAADCQYWERVLGMECRLWELRNNSRITIAAASKILANITYAYRNHGLSMGTMLAGWDKFGPSLYYVDDKGSRVKHKLFSVGSGSIYAYGVLDQGYRPDLTVEEACDLARRSIFHATYRDAGSGGIISVYHIHKNGWTKISRDDQTQLFARYFPQRA